MFKHYKPSICVTSFLLVGVLIILSSIFPSSLGAESVKEGDMAPDFTAADMQGINRSLNSHADKQVVLLDFWSIYCVSCVQQMPTLAELYNKYKDQGLMVYGIDLDTFSPKRVQKFIDGLDWKIPYPIIIDGKRQIAGSMTVSMLPSTILIGKDGKIEMFHIGYREGDEKIIEDKVKSLLN